MKFSEYQAVSVQIEQLYLKMDKENDAFSKNSNLRCVSTCGGVCCSNKDVEVSPADLIPLVISLIKNNNLEEYLVKAEKDKNEACLFFKEGKCSIYPYRATLCRLFGYSSVYNKKGQKTLSVCSYIKQATKELVCPVITESAPNLVDYSLKVNNFLPAWDVNPLPFNQAFLYAAERVYSSFLYEGESCE
jgi:Fe-S-cluster containining protein